VKHGQTASSESIEPPDFRRSQEGLRRVVYYSLLAGAAALVPIPLLDDWLFDWVRRRMFVEMLRERNAVVERTGLRILAGERDGMQAGACVYKLFFVVVVMPLRLLGSLLKGIFRKILFFLAAKQAADWASRAFHEGYLLRYALRDLEPNPVIPDARARHLRARMRGVLRETNRSPIWGIFAGVIQMHTAILKRSASVLTRVWRREADPGPGTISDGSDDLRAERTLLEDLVNRTMDVLGGERQYLETLEKRYDATDTRGGGISREEPRKQPKAG